MSAPTTTDRIQKEVTLNAGQSRVWEAITDASQFGEWFQVKLEGPFRVGETVRGQITHPGCENIKAFIDG